MHDHEDMAPFGGENIARNLLGSRLSDAQVTLRVANAGLIDQRQAVEEGERELARCQTEGIQLADAVNTLCDSACYALVGGTPAMELLTAKRQQVRMATDRAISNVNYTTDLLHEMKKDTEPLQSEVTSLLHALRILGWAEAVNEVRA